jgi:hypothetical protein
VVAEGQVQPGANLISFDSVRNPGRVAVLIAIDDPGFEPFANHLPGGVFGQAAIYSEHFHHLAVMRKVLLRMAAWMNFVLPLH